jgi:hypothetical protein
MNNKNVSTGIEIKEISSEQFRGKMNAHATGYLRIHFVLAPGISKEWFAEAYANDHVWFDGIIMRAQDCGDIYEGSEIIGAYEVVERNCDLERHLDIEIAPLFED